MKQGYTQTEAESLVGQLLETHASLSRVPRLTRGRVVAALDVGDHWNVLIEWDLPHLATEIWYDKFDVQNCMRRIRSSWSPQTLRTEMQILEIKSSHDLTATSADARRTGAHSYQIDCREFDSLHERWEKDRAQRAHPLGLTSLRSERIWITAGECKRVAAAIRAMSSPVALD